MDEELVGPCSACAKAARRESWEFRGSCPGCQARAVGRSPEFWASRMAGRLTPAYLELLRRFRLEHGDVKAAAASDALGLKLK